MRGSGRSAPLVQYLNRRRNSVRRIPNALKDDPLRHFGQRSGNRQLCPLHRIGGPGAKTGTAQIFAALYDDIRRYPPVNRSVHGL